MNQIMALKGRAAGPDSGAATVKATPLRDAPIGIEIRLLSACAELRKDWSDLAARSLEANPFFEADFALAAAQHLVAFRDACVILAWQGGIDQPGRRLVGLIPCFPRNRLFVPDQLIGLCDPRIMNGAPLLDAALAQEVIAAVLTLRQGWDLRGRGLLLRRIDLDGPLVTPLLRAAEQLGLSATLLPTPASIATARPPEAAADTLRESLSRQGRLSLVEARSRSEMRDHIELLLAMEASGASGRAGHAVLQNTREAAFLRAMTRGLAKTRQCRTALLVLDGKPIAGAIVLGRGRRNWLYRSTHDESYAPFEPERVLLAMMRQAAPGRMILHPVLPDSGGAADNLGELRLSPQAALKPRDLAGRARAALQRGLRLRRAELA